MRGERVAPAARTSPALRPVALAVRVPPSLLPNPRSKNRAGGASRFTRECSPGRSKRRRKQGRGRLWIHSRDGADEHRARRRLARPPSAAWLAHTAVPFFGPDYPGLVPWATSDHTFAARAPCDDEENPLTAAPTSLLQTDLMALVDGNDDVLHGDVTLVGSDGVSVEGHRALLYARCPKLFKQPQQHDSSASFSSSAYCPKRLRVSPSSIASPMLSPPATAGVSVEEGTASIVSDATGRALQGVVRFIYSDTLPDIDEMDEQTKKASSSSSSSSSCEALPAGLDAAFELMIAARALSLVDAPAMQHLQALFERHISKRLDLLNVVPLLTKAVDAQYAPLQQICHEFLAKRKPTTTDPTYAARLVTALGSNPAALSTSISAAAGSWSRPAASMYAPTEIPSQQLPDAMASLWRRADAMSRDRDEAGMDDPPFGPDITVTIGSGEGATRLRADRFVLASRSDYFCASLRRGDSSFQEGAAGRVTLKVPAPGALMTRT